MRLLVDTQVLIWAGQGSARLPRHATTMLGDTGNALMFSTLSVAEVAIKNALNKPSFAINPRDFRATLLAQDFTELPLTGDHACRLADLPPIHKDPFDRLLIAQALSEGVAFLTADATLADYPGRMIVV